jgi:hypothetical protein
MLEWQRCPRGWRCFFLRLVMLEPAAADAFDAFDAFGGETKTWFEAKQ